MGNKMATVAILCLLLLERFLASDMDAITEPVLRGLRVLEQSALSYTQNVIPPDLITRHKHLARFYLFTPETQSGGVQLQFNEKSGFLYFHPDRETIVIIHGFMDKVKIADWMHHMKDELLLYDDYNVIIVDWSFGNFIPYSQAAANTERVGDEIAKLIQMMMATYNAQPNKFHLIGHSLGSHVAGYVGERIQGLGRITGLDPATHLFTKASSRSKLDRTDAEFVDVIHTDAGGIGMVEPVGHVDFYPNGGEIQPGCTASNSLRTLLEKGVVEGVRNIICSHMRAALLFTDTINARHCKTLGYECLNKEDFLQGKCKPCEESDEGCALMGFHVDKRRNYGNGTKFYLLTSKNVPYCGYEYKLTLDRMKDDKNRRNILPSVFRRSEWSSVDVLHISLYGRRGSAEFSLEGKDKQAFQPSHVVFSPVDLGDVIGGVVRWSKKPLTRARGVANVISSVIRTDTGHPVIHKIQIKPMKTVNHWKNVPVDFLLCINPALSAEHVQKGAAFRNEFC